MLDVIEKARPPKTDPTGSGAILVNDILAPWKDVMTLDPFLLWHEFGPTVFSKPMPIGMHPHRGFIEAPYFKRGPLIMIDRWNPYNSAATADGHMQFGKVGRGIEHGGRFANSYRGEAHGFQLWINLPSARKLDEPHFQDAEAGALPCIAPAPGVTVTVLLGSISGATSPIDQRDSGIDVAYVDVMVEPGVEWIIDIPSSHSTCFAYAARGAGVIGTTTVAHGDIARISASAAGTRRLVLRADSSQMFDVMIVSGAPLRERVAQHGPFVMTTPAELRQAFVEYQSGCLCGDSCQYTTYSADGTRRDFSRTIDTAGRSPLC